MVLQLVIAKVRTSRWIVTRLHERGWILLLLHRTTLGKVIKLSNGYWSCRGSASILTIAFRDDRCVCIEFDGLHDLCFIMLHDEALHEVEEGSDATDKLNFKQGVEGFKRILFTWIQFWASEPCSHPCYTSYMMFPKLPWLWRGISHECR